jgi:hypothetical protein
MHAIFDLPVVHPSSTPYPIIRVKLPQVHRVNNHPPSKQLLRLVIASIRCLNEAIAVNCSCVIASAGIAACAPAGGDVNAVEDGAMRWSTSVSVVDGPAV